MPSQPRKNTRMVALLVVLAVVLLSVLHRCTATTPPQSTATAPPHSPAIAKLAGITASSYSACPPSPLEGCSCDDTGGSPFVIVNAEDGAIDTCMAGLSDSGHTKLYELDVFDYPALNLKKDIFREVQFEYLYVYNTSLQRVDENFLGNSQTFTEIIEFDSCSLLEGFPKINAEGLRILGFYFVRYSPDTRLTLRKDAFSGTPALEDLTLFSNDLRVMTVQQGSFRPLTKLRVLYFIGSIRLRLGAGHFSSPHLEGINFWSSNSDTFQADPGSLSGIPAGAVLDMNGGKVLGSWSPSKFFNILRGGTRIIVRDAFECGCDLAWIRYGSFLWQVDISCLTGGGSSIPLSEFDLSHCQFYKDQYLPKNRAVTAISTYTSP